MTVAERNLAIGKLLREEREAHQRRAYVDAELSDAASLFQKAATQLESMLAGNPSSISSVLSKIRMENILALIGEREVLDRKISGVHAELQRLRVGDVER